MNSPTKFSFSFLSVPLVRQLALCHVTFVSFPYFFFVFSSSSTSNNRIIVLVFVAGCFRFYVFFSLSFNEFIWFARSRSIFVFSIYLCLPYTIFHDVPRHILAISIIRFRFFLTLRLLVAVCFCWLTFRAACIAAYIYIHSLDDILHCDF